MKRVLNKVHSLMGICLYLCFVAIFWLNPGSAKSANWELESDTIEYVDGQLIVEFEQAYAAPFIDSVLSLHGCLFVDVLIDASWVVCTFDTAVDLSLIMEYLESDVSVRGVCPDFYAEVAGDPFPPNDTLFADQWNLENTGQLGGKAHADISAIKGWSIQTGKPQIKIGIIDSGIPLDRHLTIFPCDTVGRPSWPDLSDTSRINLAANTVPYELGCQPNDWRGGHGTAVASVLSSTRNNEFGLTGVIDSVELVIIKSYNADPMGGSPGKIAISELAKGIATAIEEGVDVINASWGRPLVVDLDQPNRTWEANIAKATYDAGVILVACVHNYPDGTVNVPAAFSQWGRLDGHGSGYSNIIAVSGTDRYDSLFFSEWDYWVLNEAHTDSTMYHASIGNSKSNDSLRTWVSAPAESVLTAASAFSQVTDSVEVTFQYRMGTSFATPQVAGLAGLLLSQDSTLTPDTVRQIIAITADKVWQDTSDTNIYIDPNELTEWWASEYWQWHPEYGFGRINCYEALRYLIWEDEVSVLTQGRTTWAEDTTIILHGDIVINPGCTLVVDQGAVIRGSSYDVTASGHADWLSEVIVAGGVLDINGTSNNPVSFIGKIDRPGQWYGIKVDSGTFTYDYLHMTNEFYDFRWDYTLDSNTTWSGTVTLRGDIVIPQGVTLTIEDSTTIEIENYDVSLYKGVDSSLIEIVVDGGTLRVNGTLANPVKFTYTDSQDSGKRVDWYGIRVKSGKCIMDYAEVRNAYAGIKMYDSTADTVKNSYFVDCGMYGLRIESDNALIQNSRISGVDPGYGIYVYQANPLIVSDSIWACETGIYSSFGSDLTIDNVKIIGPGKYGAHFCSAGDTLTTVTVDDLSVQGQIEYAHLTLGSNGYFDVSYAVLVSDTVVNDTTDRVLSIVNAGLPTKFKLRHSNLAEYGDQAFGIAFCDGRKWDLGTGSTNQGYNNISSSDTGATYFNYSGEISGGNLMARYNWWGASPPSAYKFATSGTYSVDYSSYARAPYAKFALEEQAEVSPVLPSSFSLDQNHPNPFNPSTMISYAIPVKGHVQLSIYNILGQKVRLLVDQEQQPGFHQSLWDGRDQTGREVASGIYLYRLDVANLFQQTKKMIMMK